MTEVIDRDVTRRRIVLEFVKAFQNKRDLERERLKAKGVEELKIDTSRVEKFVVIARMMNHTMQVGIARSIHVAISGETFRVMLSGQVRPLARSKAGKFKVAEIVAKIFSDMEIAFDKALAAERAQEARMAGREVLLTHKELLQTVHRGVSIHPIDETSCQIGIELRFTLSISNLAQLTRLSELLDELDPHGTGKRNPVDVVRNYW